MAPNKKTYKWFYDNIQSHYYNLLIKWCFWPLGGEKKVRDGLMAGLEFSPGDKILDMCCGTGGATFAIAGMVGMTGNKVEITAMDLSSGQIGVAKRVNPYDNVKFIVCDATSTCFKRDYFDMVFIPHALHEMRKKLRLSVLGEAKNVLKENGKLIILELDNPKSFFVRLFIWFWFFYWLPFNFETPTRRDMLRHGLTNEVEEAGSRNIKKVNLHRGIFQVVEAEK